MRFRPSIRPLILTAIAVVSACSADSSSESTPELDPDTSTRPPVLESVTTSGRRVVLRPDRVPIEVGEATFHIDLLDPLSDGTELSLDLVSPDMPMMGVRRFAVLPAEGGFVSKVVIPMAGLWNAYLNMGSGTDAAKFAFSIRAAEGAMDHDHMSGGMTDDGSTGPDSSTSDAPPADHSHMGH